MAALLACAAAQADGELVADADQRGGLVAQDALAGVVGDERLEFGLRGQLALDEEAARAGLRGRVGDADDAVDALAVDDALAGANDVARQLDADADGGLRGGAHRPASSSSPAQWALAP